MVGAQMQTWLKQLVQPHGRGAKANVAKKNGAAVTAPKKTKDTTRLGYMVYSFWGAPPVRKRTTA